MKRLLVAISISILIFTISCHNSERKADTYENLKKELKGTEQAKVLPHANPGEFESEMNNGGLNQYFSMLQGKIALQHFVILNKMV